MSDMIKISAMALDILAAMDTAPVRLSVPRQRQRQLRDLSNIPTNKRAAVKAARKAAQKTRKHQ